MMNWDAPAVANDPVGWTVAWAVVLISSIVSCALMVRLGWHAREGSMSQWIRAFLWVPLGFTTLSCLSALCMFLELPLVLLSYYAPELVHVQVVWIWTATEAVLV